MTVQILYYLKQKRYESLNVSSKQWSGFMHPYKINTEKVSSVSG